MNAVANKLDTKIDASALLRRIVMPLLLLIMIIGFSITCPGSFNTWYNFKNMFAQTGYILIASVGFGFVMLSGGIDLSIGYQMSLTSILTGILMVKMGVPTWLSIILILLVGMGIGLFNGLLCVKLGVLPMIITLSTSMIYQGISFTLSESKTILGFPTDYLYLGQGYIGDLPVSIVLAAVVIAIGIFVLTKTYIGRYVYAIGGNEEAARLAGINTAKIRIAMYVLCGFTAALASLVLTSRSASASSLVGPGTEFTCLSGCILGGITLDGGEGSLGGMVIGACIITVLGNGMQLMMLGTYPQYIAKGIVLIAAMAFDIYQKKQKVKKKAA